MKKVQSQKFKTKHMKQNVRASPARKDHHLAQVRSQFTREYIQINVRICPCLLCIVVQPEKKEIIVIKKARFSEIKGFHNKWMEGTCFPKHNNSFVNILITIKEIMVSIFGFIPTICFRVT